MSFEAGRNDDRYELDVCIDEIKKLKTRLNEAREIITQFVRVSDENPNCPVGHITEHGKDANKARKWLEGDWNND